MVYLLIIFFVFILLFLYCSLVLAKEADEKMIDEINELDDF